MNRLSTCYAKQIVIKVFSGLMMLALLLGYLPQGVAQAASPVTAPNVACQLPPSGGNSTLFLPLIQNAGSALVASVFQDTAQSGAVPREIRYEVGKTYVYEWNLKLTSQTVAHDSEGTHDNGSSATIIHAFADVIITGKNAEGVYDGQVVLRTPFICNTDGVTESIVNDANVIAGLQTPIRFQQRSNGVVSLVSVAVDVSPQVTNLQKGVLNALQVTLQDGADNYEAEEQGAQGTYKAHYTLEEKGTELQVTKRFGHTDFNTLIQGGDKAENLTMQITTTVVIDGEQGVPTSIESTERIATGADDELANTPDGNYSGATVWSKVTSLSQFSLQEVKDNSQVQSATLAAMTYIASGLGGTLPEQERNQQGIDLSQVDLDAEFAVLENDANLTDEGNNPHHVMRILDLVAADTATVVLDKMYARLQANAGNDKLAKLYVDLFTAVGTPYAQAILNEVLHNASVQSAGLAALLSPAVKEQALIDLVLLSSPTITTVNTVKALSTAENDSPLRETAISVLGATIKNLADEDADSALSLTNDLVQSLSATSAVTDVQIYLDALGNSGISAAFPVIQSYISGTVQSASIDSTILADAEVKTAALFALRNMPGQAAEQLLIDTLQNSTEDEVVRMQAATALAERPELSSVATTALQSYQSASLATPGLHRRTWYSRLGSDKIGVEFPGGLTVASPPTYYLYAYAYQQANGLLGYRRFNLATGSILAKGQSGSILFGAYLSLGGNRIRKQWEQTVACSASRSGLIWQGSVPFFSQNATIMAGPVPVTFHLSMHGWARLSYSLNANICNFYNSSASTSIIPEAWASARGETGVGIPGFNGGVGVSADLLKTKLPLTVSASYSGNHFRFCGDVKVSTQPLSGRIYGYIKVLFWRKTKTIWPFSTPSLYYTLWQSCA